MPSLGRRIVVPRQHPEEGRSSTPGAGHSGIEGQSLYASKYDQDIRPKLDVLDRIRPFLKEEADIETPAIVVCGGAFRLAAGNASAALLSMSAA